MLNAARTAIAGSKHTAKVEAQGCAPRSYLETTVHIIASYPALEFNIQLHNALTRTFA